MTDLVKKCMDKAVELHDGVKYGRDQVMLDQVKRVADLVAAYSKLTGEDKENAVAAAYLHKCFEAKRIKSGVAMTEDEVLSISNPRVLSIIRELSTEPEDKSKTKMAQWEEKAGWARTLSTAAQEILLAEKVVNFETDGRWAASVVRSRVAAENGNKPDPYQPQPGSKDTLDWHREYVATRTIMVDTLADINPRLYMAARKARAEAVLKMNAIEEQNKSIARMGYQKFNAMVNGGRV